MVKYVSKDIICAKMMCCNFRSPDMTVSDFINDELPAADVQPFKWVKREESLPVYDGLVLVVDRDNNIRLGIFTETGWLSQFGNPMMPRPKAWAKIPELPEAIKG